MQYSWMAHTRVDHAGGDDLCNKIPDAAFLWLVVREYRPGRCLHLYSLPDQQGVRDIAGASSW